MLLKTSRTETEQKILDIAEAFNYWDLLKSKYRTLHRVQLLENFIHDTDLKVMAGTIIIAAERNIKLLENYLVEFALNGPEPFVRDVNSAINSEIIQDEFVAQDIFFLLQEEIGLLLRAMRNCTTNDKLRRLIGKFIKEIIVFFDTGVKYLKIKGWIELPPIYPNIPKNVDELLDTGEAFSLWDHLTYRYDNKFQTEALLGFVYDKDFAILLKKGIQVLEKQIGVLEKDLLYFGIPLPKPSIKVVAPPENREMFTDEYIYRMLWIGIQGATSIHYNSIKHAITNDRIRGIFGKLLMEEVSLMDKYIKYGKLKCWMHIPPRYKLID